PDPTITPASAISSLNFPIAAISSGLGGMPASESLVALTIAMNRIVISPFTDTSNERRGDRHVFYHIQTARYNRDLPIPVDPVFDTKRIVRHCPNCVRTGSPAAG